MTQRQAVTPATHIDELRRMAESGYKPMPNGHKPNGRDSTVINVQRSPQPPTRRTERGSNSLSPKETFLVYLGVAALSGGLAAGVNAVTDGQYNAFQSGQASSETKKEIIKHEITAQDGENAETLGYRISAAQWGITPDRVGELSKAEQSRLRDLAIYLRDKFQSQKNDSAINPGDTFTYTDEDLDQGAKSSPASLQE